MKKCKIRIAAKILQKKLHLQNPVMELNQYIILAIRLEVNIINNFIQRF